MSASPLAPLLHTERIESVGAEGAGLWCKRLRWVELIRNHVCLAARGAGASASASTRRMCDHCNCSENTRWWCWWLPAPRTELRRLPVEWAAVQCRVPVTAKRLQDTAQESISAKERGRVLENIRDGFRALIKTLALQLIEILVTVGRYRALLEDAQPIHMRVGAVCARRSGGGCAGRRGGGCAGRREKVPLQCRRGWEREGGWAGSVGSTS